MKLETKKYKYSPWVGLLFATPPLIGLFVGLVLWLCGMTTILAGLLDLPGRYLTTSDGLGLLTGGSLSVLIAGTVLTIHTEIIATDRGMEARVFIFKWVFIPWEDVLDVGVLPLPGYNDPSSWRCIRVKKLTYLHKLASLSYGTGGNPVLIINKHLKGYEELVRIIEEHVEYNAGALGVKKC